MRLLFVVMPDSVHAVRWVELLAGRGWEIHVFPATHADWHPEWSNIVAYSTNPGGVRRVDGGPLHSSVRQRQLRPIREPRREPGPLDRLVPGRRNDRAERLAEVIRIVKPDLIHSHEIQTCAYLTLDARERLGNRLPPWIATNWGSDIYLFGRLEAHAERVRTVMRSIDYYGCECVRDIGLGREFGFAGPVLPVIPIAGGYDLDELRSHPQVRPTSARRVVALKGYQHWAGRGLVGLRAIELAADVLQDYEIVIYAGLSDRTVIGLASTLTAQATGLRLTMLPFVEHGEIMQLFGRARISIGLSISDAIGQSFLESIAMGSFPIQSNTGCANEWIEDSVSGILVHPDEPEQVAAALRRAVADDELIDRAAAINANTVRERLDRSKIRSRVVAMYEQLVAGGNAS